MRFHRFLKLATVTLVAAAVGYPNLGAQTSTTNSAPANTSGRVVVVPPSGDGKIIGSTVPAAAMPQAQESLGDAARRLRKKKRKKARKALRHHSAVKPRPQRPQL